MTFHPDRGRPAEIRGRSEPRPGIRKSSTGYPVLDFYNRRLGAEIRKDQGRPLPSHFHRGGRGRADSYNLTFIVGAGCAADPRFSRLFLWPQVGRSPRLLPSGWPPGERNRLLTSIVAVAGGAIPHSPFYRGGHGMADPAFSFLSWRRGEPRPPNAVFKTDTRTNPNGINK